MEPALDKITPRFRTLQLQHLALFHIINSSKSSCPSAPPTIRSHTSIESYAIKLHSLRVALTNVLAMHAYFDMSIQKDLDSAFLWPDFSQSDQPSVLGVLRTLHQPFTLLLQLNLPHTIPEDLNLINFSPYTLAYFVILWALSERQNLALIGNFNTQLADLSTLIHTTRKTTSASLVAWVYLRLTTTLYPNFRASRTLSQSPVFRISPSTSPIIASIDLYNSLAEAKHTMTLHSKFAFRNLVNPQWQYATIVAKGTFIYLFSIGAPHNNFMVSPFR